MPAESLQPILPSISTRAEAMPRSSIRRLFRAAQKLEQQGVDVVRLDIGDPDFDLPDRIGQAIKQALDSHHTHYSPTPGLPELRQAIARHMSLRLSRNTGDKLDQGLGEKENSASRSGGAASKVSPKRDRTRETPWDNIVCSQGATQALNACFQMTCDPGEIALLPEVYFPTYMQQLCLAGITPAFYQLDDQFLPQLDVLETLYRPGMKALLINSPSNPTGRVFTPESVRALYEFARQHSMWIISDEAYIDLVYDGRHLSPLQIDLESPEEQRRVLSVCSFSKSYATTGLRMGWTVCPNEATAHKLGLLNEPLTGSLTTPLQYGMIAALAEDDTAERRTELSQRREFAVDALREAGFDVPIPGGGIFVFLDISRTRLDGDTFADKLLAEEHVAVVPGSGFGLQPATGLGATGYEPNELAKRCIRLCYGAPADKLREGIRRLAAFAQRQPG